MKCRITDELIESPWENDDESKKLLFSDITVYDLMGEDHDVYISKNKRFGFNIEIENENGEKCFMLETHPSAIEGFASFCRRYLQSYESATLKNVA